MLLWFVFLEGEVSHQVKYRNRDLATKWRNERYRAYKTTCTCEGIVLAMNVAYVPQL